MRAKLNRNGLAAGCYALLLAAGVAIPSAQGAYITDDFQSDTAGAAPSVSSSRDYIATSPSVAMVVDSTTTPADPFGGSGNHSLLLQDKNSTENPTIWWTGAAGGLQSGDLSVQFQLDPSLAAPADPYAYAVIALGHGLSSGGAGIGGDIALAVDLFTSDAVSASVRPNFGISIVNTAALGTVHTLTLHFDLGSSTYSGKLDGVDLEKTGGGTTFPFYGSVSNIDSVALSAGWSGTTGVQVFFDNVNLSAVPEPATAGLMGMAMAGLLLKRRK